MFCPSGHNVTFEILKGCHTTTGQQKGKLSYRKSSKLQNTKYCMELICEELESSGIRSSDQPYKKERNLKEKYLCQNETVQGGKKIKRKKKK